MRDVLTPPPVFCRLAPTAGVLAAWNASSSAAIAASIASFIAFSNSSAGQWHGPSIQVRSAHGSASHAACVVSFVGILHRQVGGFMQVFCGQAPIDTTLVDTNALGVSEDGVLGLNSHALCSSVFT